MNLVNLDTRRGLLHLAALFEGGALLLGLALAWGTGQLSPETLRLDRRDVGWGVLAVVPMLALIVLAPDLRRQVRELLGKPLSECAWHDLAALSLLAGIGEELLFRGAIEPLLAGWHPWAGLIGANLLFGAAHAVSPKYFGFAAAIGVYFSWLAWGWPGSAPLTGAPNLLRPMVAHAVYDFIALMVIVHDYRRLGRGDSQGDG